MRRTHPIRIVGVRGFHCDRRRRRARRRRCAHARRARPRAGSAPDRCRGRRASRAARRSTSCSPRPSMPSRTRVTAAESIESAVGADVVVIADAADGNAEHTGEGGLALLRHLIRAGNRAPVLFAGAAQTRADGAEPSPSCTCRARVVVGSGAVRARVGVARARGARARRIGGRNLAARRRRSAAQRRRRMGGSHGVRSAARRPQLPPHTIAGLAARIPGLWPPGRTRSRSAAARVAEAIVSGSRRRFSCFVVVDSGPVRAAVVSMPVELGPQGVVRVLEPALTRQERTGMENAIEKVGERRSPN